MIRDAKHGGHVGEEEQGCEHTWSCAPARSRTLSVLNLRPSERYASTAPSSIPISLRRNASRLPNLEYAQLRKASVWLLRYLSMSQREAFVCPFGQQRKW